MKIVQALLLGAAQCIHYKLEQEPMIPVCVNANKATGEDELCMTPGNSAWNGKKEDMPEWEIIEEVYHEGFRGYYYFFDKPTNGAGYETEGRQV